MNPRTQNRNIRLVFSLILVLLIPTHQLASAESHSAQSTPTPQADFSTWWYGGVVVTSDQSVVAVGRPHISSEVTAYGGFNAGSNVQYVPMLFKNAWGSYNAALYIQNTSETNSTEVTVDFYNSTGGLDCSRNEPISKLSSIGLWMPGVDCLPDGWVGGVVLTSPEPIVAVGRPHIGSQVMTYNGFSSGSLNAYIPMLFKNAWGSYQAAFYVQNVHNVEDANVTLEFYDSSGALSCTLTDTISPYASKGWWVPSLGCLPEGWVGGVVVTSDNPIVSIGRPHLGSEVTTYNGFAGGSTNTSIPMLYKNYSGNYNSALYIQNVDNSFDSEITIDYYDADGTKLCTETDMISPLSTKGYWMPAIGCLPASWYGSVQISATRPVAAIGRAHLGSEIAAYNGFLAGNTSISVPMLFKDAFGGSYDSALYLQNLSTATTANIKIQFFDVDGVLQCTRLDTIGPLATQDYWLPDVTCTPDLVDPTYLAATAVSETQIDLSWTDNSVNETAYEVERSPDGVTNWTVIDTLPADATNYSDTSLICSSNYYYRVRAYRAGDSSYTNYSNIAPESTYECSFPAPTGLTATTASATVINLSWTDNTTDETSFHIERSPNGTDSWVEIDTVGSDQTSYADTSVSCETDYYYRVRAFRNDDATFSNYSNVDGDTSGICPLAPPSSLNAAATSQTEISLSWVDNSPDETAFHIERSPNGTDSWTEIGTVSADVTNYVDSPLTCGTTAYYRVRGYRSSNSTYSTYSNTSSDTTEYCPLAAPTNLTGTAKNKKVIQISWTDNSIDETEFRIERSPNGVDSWVEIGTAAADATSFTDNQLTCGTSYYYRVRAYRVIDDAYSDYTLVISVQTDPC